jgi:hypothetical protein
MIGHYPLGYWGSSNIFWALKQAEYANALWNFIWIFFTLYNTICSVIGQSKKKVILYYTWKKIWVNLRVMTSQQQCREQLVRYWKLWSVWLKKKVMKMKIDNIRWIQTMFKNVSDSLSQVHAMYVHKMLQINHFKKKTSQRGWFFMKREKPSAHSWTLFSTLYHAGSTI